MAGKAAAAAAAAERGLASGDGLCSGIPKQGAGSAWLQLRHRL